MKRFMTNACTLFLAALFLLSCSDKVIQAPAFYISPAAEEVAAPKAERPPVKADEGEPRLPPPLPLGNDTLPLPDQEPPELPAKDSIQQPVQLEYERESVALIREKEAVPAQSPALDSLKAIAPEPADSVGEASTMLPSSPEEVLAEDTLQAQLLEEEQLLQDNAVLAEIPEVEIAESEALEQEAQELPLREELEEEVPLVQEVRVVVVEPQDQPQQTSRNRREGAEENTIEIVRERVIVQSPELQRQQRRSLQLLEEQNDLLRQQIQNIQAQQSYFQQQNERLLTLALANRRQESSTVVTRPEPDQPYRIAGAPADSAYLRMEAQLNLLNEEVARLQTALAAAATADTLPPVNSQAPASQPDTALLSTVDELRKQIAELQQAQTDSVAQLAPLNVYFATGASSLSAEDLQQLEAWIAEAAEMSEGFSIVLNGYTDKSGPADLNLRLANKRIQSVKAALIELGVPPSRILSGYMGIDLQQQDLKWARRVQLLAKP